MALPCLAPIPAGAQSAAKVVSIPTKNNKGVKAAKANVVSVNMNSNKVAKGPSIVQLIGGAN